MTPSRFTVVALTATLVLDLVAASPAVATATWPGYHADQSRTAYDPSEPSLDPAHRAWTADLGGAVYGQAVVADGRVFAATETNRVVALDPHSGSVLWSVTLGSPLTNVDSVAGCGDIDPLGVTSTPVVDTSTHTLYVVGEISTGGAAVHHQLVGFDTYTGAITISVDVDPPLPAGESRVVLLQRAALALGNGRVYVSYGGNYGDCGHYHGWVVGVRESGPADLVSFEVASNSEGGAIWQSGGAPALDAAGDLYVATGNANPDPPQGGPDPGNYTESVVKLTPDLAPVAGFKDRVAGGDEDLSTGNPLLLPDRTVFAVGKTDIGYLLRQADLSPVAAIHGVCAGDPNGGPVYDAAIDTVFVACTDDGIQPVDLRTDTVEARLPGANGAPVLIGNELWAVRFHNGTLIEYRASTGAVLQSLAVGAQLPTFTSPSAALGLLLVTTTGGVVAFAGPSGLPARAPVASVAPRTPAPPVAPSAPAAPVAPPAPVAPGTPERSSPSTSKAPFRATIAPTTVGRTAASSSTGGLLVAAVIVSALSALAVPAFLLSRRRRRHGQANRR